jgi:hypothetical protein
LFINGRVYIPVLNSQEASAQSQAFPKLDSTTIVHSPFEPQFGCLSSPYYPFPKRGYVSRIAAEDIMGHSIFIVYHNSPDFTLYLIYSIFEPMKPANRGLDL